MHEQRAKGDAEVRCGGRNQAPSLPFSPLAHFTCWKWNACLQVIEGKNRASEGRQSLFTLLLEGPALVTVNVEMLMLARQFLSNFLFPEKSSLTVPLFNQDLQYHCLSFSVFIIFFAS